MVHQFVLYSAIAPNPDFHYVQPHPLLPRWKFRTPTSRWASWSTLAYHCFLPAKDEHPEGYFTALCMISRGKHHQQEDEDSEDYLVCTICLLEQLALPFLSCLDSPAEDEDAWVCRHLWSPRVLLISQESSWLSSEAMSDVLCFSSRVIIHGNQSTTDSHDQRHFRSTRHCQL